MQVMLEVAAYLLRGDPERIGFLDGRPFSRRYQIDNVLNTAAALHQPWRILECVCSEEVAKRRLGLQAETRAHPAGNRDYELYLQVRERFEAITLPKTIIDTAQPMKACIEQALSAIR